MRGFLQPPPFAYGHRKQTTKNPIYHSYTKRK